MDYPQNTFLLKTLTIVSGPDMVDLTFHNFVSYKENICKVSGLRSWKHWEPLRIGAFSGEQERRGGDRTLSPVSIADKVVNKQVYVPVRCGISIVLEASALHGEGPVEDWSLLSFMCFVWMNRQLRSGKVSAPDVYRQEEGESAKPSSIRQDKG